MKLSTIAIMCMVVLIVNASTSKFDKLSIEQLEFMLSHFKKIKNPVNWLETDADLGYDMKQKLKNYLSDNAMIVEYYNFYVYKPIAGYTKILMLGLINPTKNSHVIETREHSIERIYIQTRYHLSSRPLFYINTENTLHSVESEYYIYYLSELRTIFRNTLDNTSTKMTFTLENANTPHAYYAPVETAINPENIFTINDFVNYEKIKQKQVTKYLHFEKLSLKNTLKNTKY